MDIQKLDSWNSLLRAVPAATLLIFVAQFLGSGLVSWTRLCCVGQSWARFHVASILGINLLGLYALSVAWLPATFRNALTLAVCLVAIYWTIHVHWTTRERRWFANLDWRSWQSFSWPQWIVASQILFTLGPALSYPSGWDELCYHLELPRRWYELGSLSVQPDLPYSALPSLLEVIWTSTYPLEALITPRLLIWVVWLHGLFIFRAACGQVCNDRNASILTFAMVASPSALMISANCYVESLIWANVACLLWMIVGGPHSLANRYSILFGLFIGGAIAIKMTSVGLLCLPILLAFLKLERAPLTWTQTGLVVLTAGCFAGPFYFRSWAETGNPVSPFFAQFFTSDSAWIACSQYHHDLAISNFGMRGMTGLIVGPSALAFAIELYDGSLGWQWLLIALLLAVAVVRGASLDKPRRKMIWLCSAAAVLFYGIWFLTAQQARFAIPLVMIVILTAGIGIETYREPVQRWWRIALVGLSLVSVPWTNFGYYLDSWLCVFKVRTPVDYIRDGVTDSYTELAIYLHESIPTDAKIVSLFEHRLAYLPRGVEIATPYFQVKYFRSPADQTAENLLEELREHDIRYVVLTTTPLGPDVSSNRIADQQQWFRNIDQCVASGKMQVIWKSEQHAVAEMKY